MCVDVYTPSPLSLHIIIVSSAIFLSIRAHTYVNRLRFAVTSRITLRVQGNSQLYTYRLVAGIYQ
jgi:hypothetical protein